MTEKRYYLENFKDFTVITLRLYDRKIKHKHYDWLTESHKIVDLLNALHEENEQLKDAIIGKIQYSEDLEKFAIEKGLIQEDWARFDDYD